MEETSERCPICLEPFRAADLCSTDIELGACHAACLEGSPTVDLETGEPVDGPIPTYRYDDDGPRTKDSVDNLIDFILSDDSPVTQEDVGDLKIFDNAIEAAERKLSSSTRGE